MKSEIFYQKKIEEDFIIRKLIQEEILMYDRSFAYMDELLQNVDTTFYTEYYFSILNNYKIANKMISEIDKNVAQGEKIDIEALTNFLDEELFLDKEVIQDIAFSLQSNNITQCEKSAILLELKSYTYQRLIGNFYSYSFPLTYGEIINISQKDTIKIGEKYKSQIVFNLMDLKRNTIIMEEGDTLQNGIFEEISIKKGINNKKGYIYINNLGKTLVFDVEFDYFVK